MFGRYADENFGGVERYVFELACALQGEVEFANIVARRGPPPDTVVGSETLYSTPIAHVGGAPICPSMPLHALRLHRRRPFDIVHLQFPADPMAHLAAMALPRTVRRVITWHSDIVRQRTLLRLYKPFLEQLLRSADAIILPTPAHYTSSQQLPHWASREKMYVVPFGRDYAKFMQRPALADDLRRRHGSRFLIFALGRHVYYKGFEFLIRSMRELRDAMLIIGGCGPLTESLVALAGAVGVRERVELVGRIPEAELPAYYHACDVFCMPSDSRAEGFGFVQIEAMACGRPVVCCDLNNGVTWVNRHEETGVVVSPADTAALTSALQRLRSDADLRSRLGQQGRERALQGFSLEAMARGTIEVYRKVLAQPRL